MEWTKHLEVRTWYKTKSEMSSKKKSSLTAKIKPYALSEKDLISISFGEQEFIMSIYELTSACNLVKNFNNLTTE